MRSTAMPTVSVLLALVVTALGSAGEPTPSERSDKGYEFGDKVVYVVTKPKDARSESG